MREENEINKGSENREGTTNHSHGTAESQLAGIRSCEIDFIDAARKRLHDVEIRNDDLTRAAESASAVDHPFDGNTRLDREIAGFVACACHFHRYFLHTVRNGRFRTDRSRRTLEDGRKVETRQRKSAVQVKQGKDQHERTGETQEDP